jgi:alcohol dehydrogenase
MIRKAYKMIPGAGSINNLQFIEEELGSPGKEEVSIEVHSIGLNFADIFAIFGLYSATPKGPFIPGLEFSGKIIAAGQDVPGFKIGDRVMGVTRFGGYTDHLNISYRYLIQLHDDWTFEEGAAFMVQAFTAYYALIVLGDIRQGQTILIHSAAGGVGLFANRIAKCFGAYTIGSIGSSNKIDLLKKEGYDDFIVRSENFRQDLDQALSDRELNIVLECIGGQVFKDSFRLMAREGRMVVYGAAQYASPGKRPNYLRLVMQYLRRPKIDPMKMVEWNKSVMGFNLIHLYDKKEYITKYLGHIQELDLGKPIVGHTYPFEQLIEAIRMFQKGMTTGKVVVNVTKPDK